jgi:hypothetical protein
MHNSGFHLAVCAMVLQKNENPDDELFFFSNTDLSQDLVQTSSMYLKLPSFVSVFASYGRARTVHNVVIRCGKAF